MIIRLSIFALLIFASCHKCSEESQEKLQNKDFKPPTLLIGLLIRNKAHVLPYSLSLLEQLSYPKDRISLWIHSDHNIDETLPVLKTWISSVKDLYHDISYELHNDKIGFADETGPAHWSSERFEHVISLREKAVKYARKIWARYFMFLDADILLTDPHTVQQLMAQGLAVVAPMLRSDGLYSNFWHGMTTDYYYMRTDDYKPIVNRENLGCFRVPMIHSCVLIDLDAKITDSLTYSPDKIPDYDGPKDDIIAFAVSANRSQVPLHVCNDQIYGFISPPLEQNDTLARDHLQLVNLKVEALSERGPIEVVDSLAKFVRKSAKDTLGVDAVYMVNLVRRPERRSRMLACFDELGINATLFNAVDGRSLDNEFLDGIKFMPNFADPYHKRPMTLGEIGCFMSHYKIWKDALERNLHTIMVLEDDIRFEPFFRYKVSVVLSDLAKVGDWDLVYLGRKRLQESDEPIVEGTSVLVHAGYSYWTLGYLLSTNGAKKLVDASPLQNLVPVDEYLPILFDKHPRSEWKNFYPRRDLIAYSAEPLLLYPTHYTGEQGYISDTENSSVIKNEAGAKEEL